MGFSGRQDIYYVEKINLNVSGDSQTVPCLSDLDWDSEIKNENWLEANFFKNLCADTFPSNDSRHLKQSWQSYEARICETNCVHFVTSSRKT
jgi:hypothetical protein